MATAQEDSPQRGSTLDVSLRSGGLERDYRLYIPASYDPQTPTPLVVMLHGLTSNITDIEYYTEISQKADQAGFIVAYPQSLGGPAAIWITTPGLFLLSPDLTFIEAMLEEIRATYTLDPARLYVLGYSNGAAMAHLMACELSEQVAAIGTVGGTYWMWQEPCNPTRGIPVMTFHAIPDPTVPYDGIPFVFESAPSWVLDWVARNDCAPDAIVSDPQPDMAGQTWAECRDGAEVIFYSLNRRTHNWPGGNSLFEESVPFEDIQANDYFWEFFMQHPLPQ
jgi:polyhydroxybutyrate depolymerase